MKSFFFKPIDRDTEIEAFLTRIDQEWLGLEYYGQRYHLSLLDPKKDYYQEPH